MKVLPIMPDGTGGPTFQLVKDRFYLLDDTPESLFLGKRVRIASYYRYYGTHKTYLYDVLIYPKQSGMFYRNIDDAEDPFLYRLMDLELCRKIENKMGDEYLESLIKTEFLDSDILNSIMSL